MFRWSSFVPLLLSVFIITACTTTPPADPAATAATAAATAAKPDPMMQLHHLHGLMAHGFEMALEGANLSMLAAMKMSPIADAAAESHGATMVSEGRALIEQAINGPVMHTLHDSPMASDAVMTYTHDLAKAMTSVLDHLTQMPAGNPANKQDMAMHHLHIATAHAASMASQAAALKMTASMKMAGEADAQATSHATAMFGHARALQEQAMSGEAMKEAHGTANADAMQLTHDMGDAVKLAIDLLEKMP